MATEYSALFQQFCAQHGYEIGDPDTGDLVRFPISGDRGDKKSGYYRLHDDERPNGFVGDWRSGQRWDWRPEIAATLNREAAIAHRKKMDDRRAERQRQAENAAIAAQMKWRRARPADPNHPYLVRKKILPNGARQIGNGILIPVHAPNGHLMSVKTIYPAGSKK